MFKGMYVYVFQKIHKGKCALYIYIYVCVCVCVCMSVCVCLCVCEKYKKQGRHYCRIS